MTDTSVEMLKHEIASLKSQLEALTADLVDLREHVGTQGNGFDGRIRMLAHNLADLHNAFLIHAKGVGAEIVDLNHALGEMYGWVLPALRKLFPGISDDEKRIGDLIKKISRPRTKDG